MGGREGGRGGEEEACETCTEHLVPQQDGLEVKYSVQSSLVPSRQPECH